MKRKEFLCNLNGIKLAKIILLSFYLSFGCTTYIKAQLSKHIFCLNPTSNLYDIKEDVDPYMDSLMLVWDSASFFAEGGAYHEYRKFMDFWEPRLYPHGNFDMYFTSDSIFHAGGIDNMSYVSDKPWHEIGPLYVPEGIGPTEFITFYDCGNNDSTNFMLTGATLSGLFYSKDGGEHWSVAGSDKWESSGCGWAVFHPQDHRKWFASSGGNSSGISGYIGSGGIYRTYNEGETWHKIADADDFDNHAQTVIIKLVINPVDPDILFAVTSCGVYKTDESYENDPEWTCVFNSSTFDMEIKPDLPSCLYITAIFNGEWKILKSTDSGETWSAMIDQPEEMPSAGGYDNTFTIEVSKAKPNYLYCSTTKPSTDGLAVSLYYYDFEYPGWTTIERNCVNPYCYGHGHGFGVEQVVDGETILLSVSLGMKKYKLPNISLGEKSPNHVDVEDIVFHPYNRNEVWACTHGGVEKSVDLGDEWDEKYSGLGVANVERMATSFTNPEYVIVGRYHDGNHITRSQYVNDWKPVWDHVGGLDGMRPLIDDINPSNMWTSSQNGGWLYSDDYYHQSFVYIPMPCYFNTEGTLNKLTTSTIFRKGYYNQSQYEEVYRSPDRGLSINECISNFRSRYGDYNILKLLTPYTNQDYLMVLLRETSNPDTPRGEAIHLFLTTNANDLPGLVEWDDLEIPENLWVGSVCFDPYDEDIIYMADYKPQNSTDYQLVYKADYDGSEPVFKDLTGNLPDVYIGADGADGLVAENSDRGGIYLSTDEGVFYTDNQLINNTDVEWKILGTGLPHVIGRRLEINYFNNKLRLGTWGRGTWENDLPCFHETTPLQITANTTWNTFNRLDSNVVVKTGNTLTISEKARIMLPEDAQIIVESGARLIIDGGTVSSACRGPWRGIEIWGNPSLPQTTENQGTVEIFNGGTIENALVAVRLGKTIIPEGDGEVTYGDGGGIIKASDAVFRNNRTGVVFERYTYSRDNVSYFDRCTFETTAELPDGHIPQYFVMMNSVTGVDFRGCAFNNSRPLNIPFNLRGNGIYSMNSQFSVDHICISGTIPCEEYLRTFFSDLNYGINAYGINTNRTCSIKNSEFNRIRRGVYISAVPNITLRYNIFNVDMNNEIWITRDTVYAFYLDHTTGYEVTENVIKDRVLPPPDKYSIGIIINQSGEANNMIYNNNFEKLYTAVLAQNENRSINGLTGLTLKCNEFTGNSYDIAITKSSTFMTQRTGIAMNQGADLPKPDAPAGNLFSWTGPTGIPTDINNQTQHITYYYHAGYPTIHLEPKYITPLTVTPHSVNAEWNENSCPPLLDQEADIAGLKIEMTDAGQQADSLRVVITTLEDAGNTDELKQDVENSIPPESMQIYLELMNTSPYITDTVLDAAIVKENVLFDAMIRDVLVANPHSAKDDALLEKLENRTNTIPGYMIEQILQGRSLVSVYEQLQSKLAYFSQKQAEAYRGLVNYYMTDTLNPAASTDSLIQLLETTPTPEAEYQLVFLYIEQGYYSQAFDLLDEIPGRYELTQQQLTEHQNLADYCSLLSEINGAIPDSAQVSSLNQIYTQQNGMASMFALNYLIGLERAEYCEPILLPDNLKTSEEIRFENLAGQTHRESKKLEVFPNPASDYVIISWKTDAVTFSGTITVTGYDGKHVSEIPVLTTVDQKVFNTSKLAAGVYIVTLHSNGKMMDSVKFTVIKH